jgi:hypothetical protein
MIAAAPSSAHPPATAYTILYLPSITARMNGATGRRDRERQRIGAADPGQPVLRRPLTDVGSHLSYQTAESGWRWSGVRHIRRPWSNSAARVCHSIAAQERRRDEESWFRPTGWSPQRPFWRGGLVWLSLGHEEGEGAWVMFGPGIRHLRRGFTGHA